MGSIRTTTRSHVEGPLLGMLIMTGAGVVYQLALLVAAAVNRGSSTAPYSDQPALRLAILIPARNEAQTLEPTLAGVARLDYPAALLSVVVIADNCADETAAIAVARGARVLERKGGARGKGHALAWALERLSDPHDAVVFLDADCIPSRNLASALERRLRAGARVVQADYVVANPEESWASALRFASFVLINTVRSRGKQALGLSSGIHGTGFAVARDVLDARGWSAFSAVEDTEYQVGLLHAGIRVSFAPEASVSSRMATRLRASTEQHARWERGKLIMLRRWIPGLLSAGLRRRDARLLHAAVEGVLPPQAALASLSLSIGMVGAVLRARALIWLAAANAIGQLVYVLGGLLLVRAPANVYRALLAAPLMIGWKIGLYARMALGRAPQSWHRGAR